jgi:hypothetical protein
MRKTGIIIFLFIINISFSQEVSYKVFFFDGKIELKGKGASGWSELNTLNVTLDIHDSLALAQDSYIYLVDRQGNQVYLDHPGRYEVVILQENDGASESQSLFAKYAEFVWEELNKSEKDIEDYADRTLKEKGGVKRAVNIPPILLPYYGSHEMAEEIVFLWEDTGAEEYVLSFWDSDMDGKWLFSVITSDTVIALSTRLEWVPTDVDIFFTLTEKKRPANNFIPIRVLSPEKQRPVLDELEHIASMKAHEQVKLLLTASMYEENRLYSEAEKTYRKALELDPGNEEVLLYYSLFKERRGWGKQE